MRRMRGNRNGFGLLEVLIGVGILAIVAVGVMVMLKPDVALSRPAEDLYDDIVALHAAVSNSPDPLPDGFSFGMLMASGVDGLALLPDAENFDFTPFLMATVDGSQYLRVNPSVPTSIREDERQGLFKRLSNRFVCKQESSPTEGTVFYLYIERRDGGAGPVVPPVEPPVVPPVEPPVVPPAEPPVVPPVVPPSGPSVDPPGVPPAMPPAEPFSFPTPSVRGVLFPYAFGATPPVRVTNTFNFKDGPYVWYGYSIPNTLGRVHTSVVDWPASATPATFTTAGFARYVLNADNVFPQLCTVIRKGTLNSSRTAYVGGPHTMRMKVDSNGDRVPDNLGQTGYGWAPKSFAHYNDQDEQEAVVWNARLNSIWSKAARVFDLCGEKLLIAGRFVPASWLSSSQSYSGSGYASVFLINQDQLMGWVYPTNVTSSSVLGSPRDYRYCVFKSVYPAFGNLTGVQFSVYGNSYNVNRSGTGLSVSLKPAGSTVYGAARTYPAVKYDGANVLWYWGADYFAFRYQPLATNGSIFEPGSATAFAAQGTAIVTSLTKMTTDYNPYMTGGSVSSKW